MSIGITALSSQNITTQTLAEQLNAQLFGDGTAIATDVTHDSRQAGEGTIFVAIKGATMDGHRFVVDVMRRGAAGIISEYDPPADSTGAWLKVANAREALAKAAAVINGNPSHELDLVGITGTNGKTTTTYLCFALAEAAKQKAAMLTTVEYRIGEKSEEAVRTTPEASDTNRFLREAVDAGCTVAVMETSSQAIDLHRCDWLRFKVAVFTNLTRDHLDYHETMENYFDAKKKLLDGGLGEKPGSCVINIDDEWGAKLASELIENGQRVITTSLSPQGEPPASAGGQTGSEPQGIKEIKPPAYAGGSGLTADLLASNIEVSLVRGTSFDLKTPAGNIKVNSPLVGRPHVYNMLSATATALELGFDLDSIQKGLSTCVGAPGRFERVPHDGDFAVVVDYAHTDDALLNTLKTAKDLTDGKIITVFGCGGDRDRTKRRPMGEIAGEYSDLVFITSDNPRNEDPLKIIEEIEVGVKEKGVEYYAISDRREAIYKAVAAANTNDVVIIAGKGHENYQLVNGNKFHFDDREVAMEALARKNEEA
ncbi:MAG: UDP-N-acetylmuramoyl-L-alanyl-D-glutamate--2,6-diaminopimelate ligase [Pyrinomonadaceae bacterium]